MKKLTAAMPSCREGFNQRLLGYSATAGAVLLVAPAVHAQAILTLTTFSLNGGPFGTTPPISVSVLSPEGLEGSYGSSHFRAATAGHAVGFSGILREKNGFYHLPNAVNAELGIVSIAGGNVAVENVGYAGVALNLGFGAPIAGRKFSAITNVLADRGSDNFMTAGDQRVSSHSSKGNFLAVGNSGTKIGYIGFKRDANGKTYYGWLRVKVTNDSGGFPLKVTFVANGNGVYGAFGLASDGITAGEIGAIPEPASVASGLGLLALGAAGVREMRRRRTVVA